MRHAVVFGVICLLLQVFLPYQRYVRYLKWLTLALLAYVVAGARRSHIPWREVRRARGPAAFRADRRSI